MEAILVPNDIYEGIVSNSDYENVQNEYAEMVEMTDNIFGKKARQRRQAKKAAKKEARSAGLSGKAIRLAGKSAKLQVKAEQKPERKLLQRRVAKIGTKAQLAAEGVTGQELRRGARSAMQQITAQQIRQKAATKTGQRAQKLLEKAERVQQLKGKSRAVMAAKRAGVAAITAPLLPLKKTMQNMLRKRGVNPPANMVDLAEVFYNEVVVKNNKNTYDHVNPIDTNSGPSDNVAPALAAIVTAIVAFIKNARKKKETGQPMTKSEEQAAKGAEQVEKIIIKQAEEQAAQEVGQKILFDQKTWFLIGGGLLGLILLVAFIAKR